MQLSLITCITCHTIIHIAITAVKIFGKNYLNIFQNGTYKLEKCKQALLFHEVAMSALCHALLQDEELQFEY